MLGAHGIRGELKCRIVTDFPSRRFRRGHIVVIDGVPHTIQAARVQAMTVLLKLEDVPDRDAAETFRGKDVQIRAEDAVALPKGQYFWHQVIGLQVEDATTREALGKVTDILETGANDVYVVRGGRGEILVPAIKEVVKRIDPAAGVMLIEPLPGLLPG
ncbi:MAG: ribosome maturation factor RimM [Chloroflexota bacterium]|nr:ribosome maturation factor RimM [Chloroflexota bacterium]